jgi:large subunit ribosomal protein L9
MDVILLENIRNLGKLGAKVRVANGFGRNFLIPKGKAISATRDNLAKFEAQRAELERASNERLQKAQERSAAINNMVLTITAKAGEEGKLFGSIGTIELVRAFSEKGIELHRDEIRLPNGPLREIGEQTIEVQLHAEVIAQAHVTVVPEKEK